MEKKEIIKTINEISDNFIAKLSTEEAKRASEERWQEAADIVIAKHATREFTQELIKNLEYEIKDNVMKCPYCGTELEELIPSVYSCYNQDCKAMGIVLPEYMWLDIIYGVRFKDVFESKEGEAHINKDSKTINLSIKSKE